MRAMANALPLLCPDGAVGVAVAARDEAVFHIYRYETGIWGFIDSFRVVLACGMRKWYASY